MDMMSLIIAITSMNVPTLQDAKSVSVVSNGSILIIPDTGNDAMKQVNLITAVPQGEPIEIDTDAGMAAVLTAANVGKAYRFTGTTGTYTNGDIYVVEESE